MASISDENRKEFPTGRYSKSEIADAVVLMGTLGLFSTGQVKPLKTEGTISGFVLAKGSAAGGGDSLSCSLPTMTAEMTQPQGSATSLAEQRLMLMWRKGDEAESWRWVLWKQAPNIIFFQIIILALFIWISLLPAMKHMGFHTNTAGLLHALVVDQCP